MIILHTDTTAYYLHDDGLVYNSNDLTNNKTVLLFDSLDAFLKWNTVSAITSEDGYKFTVTADYVTNGDMSFNNLESAIEELQQ